MSYAFTRTHALLGLVVAAACDPAAKSVGERPRTTHPSERGVDAVVECVDEESVALQGELLTRFDGRACPWVATVTPEGALELVSLEQGRARLRGPAPRGCTVATCRAQGVESAIGPLLLLERADPDHERGRGGEAPDGVWLGAGAGEALGVTPLWLGEPSHGDSTDLGPVFELAPTVCGEQLVLRATSRLRVAGGEELPEVVRAAEGVYQVVEGEAPALQRSGDAPPPAGCVAVALELP